MTLANLESLAKGKGEWDAVLTLVKSGYPTEKAQRLALIWVFGDEWRYHTDPLFHAQIEVAMQLLKSIEEARPSA